MVKNNFVRLGVESNWMSEILLFSVCEYMGVGLINLRYSPFYISLFTAWGDVKIVPSGGICVLIFEKRNCLTGRAINILQILRKFVKFELFMILVMFS